MGDVATSATVGATVATSVGVGVGVVVCAGSAPDEIGQANAGTAVVRASSADGWGAIDGMVGAGSRRAVGEGVASCATAIRPASPLLGSCNGRIGCVI